MSDNDENGPEPDTVQYSAACQQPTKTFSIPDKESEDSIFNLMPLCMERTATRMAANTIDNVVNPYQRETLAQLSHPVYHNEQRSPEATSNALPAFHSAVKQWQCTDHAKGMDGAHPDDSIVSETRQSANSVQSPEPRPQSDFEEEDEDISMDDTTQVNFQPTASASATIPARTISRNCSQSPSFNATRGARMMSPQDKSKGVVHGEVLAPQNSRNRVTKSPSQSHTPHKVSPSGPNPSRTPSEEDLMLLLLRRQRKQTEVHDKLIAAYRHCAAEHAQLKVAHADCERDLHAIESQYREVVLLNHVREGDLRKFKDKYSSLKQCVKELASDFAAWRAGHSGFKEVIKELRADHASECTSREELLKQCQSILGVFDKIKDSIAAIKVDFPAADLLKQQLAQATSQLRGERLQNKTHALYISRLESSQRSMQTNFTTKLADMTAEIKKINTSVARRDGSLSTDLLAPILDALHGLQERETEPANQHELQAVLNTLEQNHDRIEEVLQWLQASQDDQHAASNLHMSTLVSTLDKLRPHVETMQALQADNAALVEKSKRTDELRVSDRREKEVAQLLASGLLEVHKQTVSKSVTTVCGADASKDKEIESLKDGKQQALTRAVNAEGRAKNFESQAASAQSSIESLERDIVQSKESHESYVNQLAAQHNQVLQELNDNNETRLGALGQQIDQARSELQSQKDVTADLQSRYNTLHEQSVKQSTDASEKALLILNQANQIDSLAKDKNNLQQRIEDTEKLKQQINDLQDKLHTLESSSEQLSAVQQQKDELDGYLAQTREEVTQLKNQLSDFQKLKAEFNTTEQELQKARKEEEKLSHAQAEIARLEEICSASAEREQVLTDKLNTASEKATKSDERARTIDEKVKQIGQLEAEISVARVAAQQKDALQTELDTAYKARDELTSNLEVRERSLAQCKASNKDLNHEVSRLKAVESDLQEARADIQRGNVEMASMQDNINKLTEEIRCFDMLRRYLTDDEIAQFDEPIVLSFKSVLHQTQSQREAEENGDLQEPDSGFVKPRRAANRNIEDNGNIVVPDSQTQGHSLRRINRQTVSPEPFPELSDYEVATQEAIQAGSQNPFEPLPLSQSIRPGTPVEDMLLLPSETGSLSPSIYERQEMTTVVQVPANRHGPGSEKLSPMKTRGGSQIRHNTPGPRLEAGKVPQESPRQSPIPNSAAKRRVGGSDETSETDPKRPRTSTNMDTLAGRVQSNTLSKSKSTRFATEDQVFDLPMSDGSSSKPASLTGSNAPTPGKKRSTNAKMKVSSKHNKFAQRFNGVA